jgi:hypothetical protein
MVMANPFDLRTVFFAKHAQHVVLIHFPIALFISAVVFDFLSQWTKRLGLADAAYYNLLVAAASTLPVLATGLLAWQFQLAGKKLNKILLFCTPALSPDGSPLYVAVDNGTYGYLLALKSTTLGRVGGVRHLGAARSQRLHSG